MSSLQPSFFEGGVKLCSDNGCVATSRLGSEVSVAFDPDSTRIATVEAAKE